MSPELYTDEFRNFKYLKSDYRTVQFYKKSTDLIDKIAPWNAKNDMPFQWPCRVEFFEQILDLSNDCLYIVDPPVLDGHKSYFNYDDGRLFSLDKPFLYKGSMMHPSKGIPATIVDIPVMENQNSTNTIDGYFLCSNDYIIDRTEGNILPVSLLPIVDRGAVTLSAMFYSKEWAENYQKSLTTFLRKNIHAISTISRMF